MIIIHKLKQNIIKLRNSLNKSNNLFKTFVEMLKIEIKISLIIFIFSTIALVCLAFLSNDNKYAIAAITEKPQKINSYNLVINNYTQEKIKYQEIIDLVNVERKKYNLNKLEFNSQLEKMANNRIIDMKNKHYFAHINPDNNGLKYFVEQVDYNYLIVGENLAMNYYDNSEVVQAWMESPSHKKNILKPSYSEIGIESGEIKINGKNKFVIAMILGVKK